MVTVLLYCTARILCALIVGNSSASVGKLYGRWTTRWPGELPSWEGATGFGGLGVLKSLIL